MSKKLPEKHTSKKIKYIGAQEFINPTTGEVIECQVTEIEERDFNFSKVWMRNFIATLDMVGNQKTKIAFWIIENLNKENQLVGTVRSISDATGISHKTCADTMSILQQADFIRKVRNGVYEVNPDIVFKGSRNARLNALTSYKQIGFEPKEPSKEERIQTIKKTLRTLQYELIKLEASQSLEGGQMEFLPDGTIVERMKDGEE